MQYAAEVSERFHYVDILARHRQGINNSFQDVSECLNLSFDPGDTQPHIDIKIISRCFSNKNITYQIYENVLKTLDPNIR